MFRVRDGVATDPANRAKGGKDYEAHKEDMRQRMAAKVAIGQEIGPLPEVVNPQRKEECRYNLQLFSETYVPGLFKGVSKRWAPFHVEAFVLLQQAVFNGGLVVIAVPRGSGKSAMIKAQIIWAAVYGHCHFAVVVCATNPLAINFLRSVKKQLRGAKLLYQDFPEVCYPIRLIENKASKCNGQKLDGVRTAMEWGYAHIVLPTIPGAKSSGFKVATSGITGSGLRGLIDGKEDGTEERPDIVSVDDFQTPASARSPGQVVNRLDIIRGSILGMAGPGEKIAVTAAVTVIEKGDGADQLCDDPNWRGVRHGILDKLPDNLDLWRQYRVIQSEAMAQKIGPDAENEFYRDNQAAMDSGCVATWPDRFGKSELSAIQSAMNLFFLVQPKAFWAEYMNQPEDGTPESTLKLNPDDLRTRLNQLPRGRVPLGFSKVTAMIDVQMRLLWYMVVAWRDDFTGAIIDYGWMPDQKGRRRFDLNDLVKTLQTESGCIDTDIDGAISWGLDQLGELVLGEEWIREDGVGLNISRAHIDINNKPFEAAVARFCRTSRFKGIAFPSRGMTPRANRRRISQWAPKDGEHFPRPAERAECEWMGTTPKHHRLPEYYFDPNHWKTRMLRALSLPLHSPGSISLYGTTADEHAMLIEHLTSHYQKTVQYENGSDILHYLKPGVERDDLLDTLVGSAVAASIEGVKLGTEQAVASAAKKRVFSLPGGKR